jgi:hypothetical protein
LAYRWASLFCFFSRSTTIELSALDGPLFFCFPSSNHSKRLLEYLILVHTISLLTVAVIVTGSAITIIHIVLVVFSIRFVNYTRQKLNCFDSSWWHGLRLTAFRSTTFAQYWLHSRVINDLIFNHQLCVIEVSKWIIIHFLLLFVIKKVVHILASSVTSLPPPFFKQSFRIVLGLELGLTCKGIRSYVCG